MEKQYKYVWLIKALLGRWKTYEELKRKWYDEKEEDLPPRTFIRWKEAIMNTFGIHIVNEGCPPYRYYIENEEDIKKNSIESWMLSTISVGNTLSGCQRIKGRIVIERVPSGEEYLQTVIEAMKVNRVLNMTYHSFWHDHESTFDVEPYCVKLFRQRWYMVGKSALGVKTYALDRIVSLRTKEGKFEMEEGWSAEDYFNGRFGIIVDGNAGIETVRLKAYGRQADYIRTLKIHESQEEEEKGEQNGEKYSIFRYRLRPTFDLLQEILWHRDSVEVLEPQWFRQEVAGTIDAMRERYRGEEKKGLEK